jgi:transposase
VRGGWRRQDRGRGEGGSEPEALVGFFRGLETGVTRIGLEAGPLSQWLYAGLAAAGFEVVRDTAREGGAFSNGD